MNDIPWNRITLDEYTFLCPPTPAERIVLLAWAAGDSIPHTAMHNAMSDSQVEKIRARIRQKYDEVQPYTPLLPARRK